VSEYKTLRGETVKSLLRDMGFDYRDVTRIEIEPRGVQIHTLQWDPDSGRWNRVAVEDDRIVSVTHYRPIYW